MRAAVLLSEHVSESLRTVAVQHRRAGRRPCLRADMRGACWSASILLAEALSVHGVEAQISEGLFRGAAHAWVRVDDHFVDITATQFGLPDIALVTTARDGRYLEFCRKSLSGRRSDIMDSRFRAHPSSPCWHFDTMVRALSRALGITEGQALLRVLHLVGPPYMGKGRAVRSDCFARLGSAIAASTERGGQ